MTSIGIAFKRRLESVSDLSESRSRQPQALALIFRSIAAVGDGPAPVLSGQQPTQWLDSATQANWASNDMTKIEAHRSQASKDLLPIYRNIDMKGKDAWVHVQDKNSGKKYYVSYSTDAVIWSYLDVPPTIASDAADPPQTKNVIQSIGSYSKTANFLGISTYTWSNIPVSTARWYWIAVI